MKKGGRIFLCVGFCFLLTGCKERRAARDFIPEAEDTVKSGEMRVTFLDVGQGDCSLIQTEHKNMLIDAGDNHEGRGVVAYLRERGVEKLSYLILSHPDIDHIGGADDVLENIEVGHVIMTRVPNDTATYQEVMEAVEKYNADVIYPRVGKRYRLEDADFMILCPEEKNQKTDDRNDSSVGIRLRYGRTVFLMCGDAQEKSEKEMVKRFGKGLECDVLKVNHHGSDTATTEEFLDAANPSWAVVSCGEDNPYGHPHAEVIERLKEHDVQIYRTDELGTITAVSDGTNLMWKHKGKTN